MLLSSLFIKLLFFFFILFPVITSSGATTSSLSIFQRKYKLPLKDILHLDGQDFRDLGVSLNKRIKIKQELSRSQEFTFVVSHFNSTRQWGKCLNIIIKYRYLPNASANSTGGGYLDYREMRNLATKLAQPTRAFPQNVQWEAINIELVNQIMNKYESQIIAVSSQIQVLSELNSHIDEPGNHGSIVTDGSIVPLNEPWINAFRYDCTKVNRSSVVTLPTKKL
jgi:hypothetical protein